MNKTMQEMLQKADRVIIPESGMDKDNIVRTGPIVRKIQKKREDVRELLDFKKKTIVLCAGGTEAGKFLIKQTIDAMEKIELDIERDLHHLKKIEYPTFKECLERYRDEIIISIELGRGDKQETVWTSDLSHDYVRINSDYRT